MSAQIPNPYALPADLPVPEDDGACAHLTGDSIPDIDLLAVDGKYWNLAQIAQEKVIFYIYPATGVPGTDPIPEWDAIPGAPGCTLQSLGFREHAADFARLSYQVFGISAQSTSEQMEFRQRVHLPFILLSDPLFLLREQLNLPTFDAQGKRFYKRLVLVVHHGEIVKVFYPVFPPDQSAAMVLQCLISMIE